ncbi:hypothetical protein JX266_001746 [Neoarthrinium moseri]|nr:hypothetical protein JX266_001746 [Neoarthrinium moseri]
MPSLSRRLCHGLAATCGLVAAASAGILRSRSTEGVQVTFKEPGICETTPGVKSYSGYVTLPSTSLQPYPQKTFFWFFESRNAPETAPLSIWLQGGPGSPSIDQALSENGPCIVQPDSNSTVLNPWSWTNHANILYIDQPLKTGFSYDEAIEGVVDMITGDIYPADQWTSPLNYTAVKGTYTSQKTSDVVSTTAVAAEAIWEFLQVWMGEFKQYRRDKISVWSQSYGGHYAPAVANLLHTRSEAAKNKKRACGGSSDRIDISVDSVGIVNGFIDFLLQGESFTTFAVNNTYGIQAYSQEVAAATSGNFSGPGGCKEQAEACRALTPNGYRDQYGTNATVSKVCGSAFLFCWANVYVPYESISHRDGFDIAQASPVSFPPTYALGYLDQDWVREALGAEVKYNQQYNLVPDGLDIVDIAGDPSNPYVTTSFSAKSFFFTGDFVFGGFSEDLGSLLDAGVKVALIYGDRDYRCNWVGGEAVSLSINHRDKDAFAGAGYAQMHTNDSYVGGMVRQHKNFSFTRVFDAGHTVASYQPETAYQLFMRSVLGYDVATGTMSLKETPEYATDGPASVFNITNTAPASSPNQCYVRAFPLGSRCTEEQLAALQDGTAVVENDIVVSPAPQDALAGHA